MSATRVEPPRADLIDGLFAIARRWPRVWHVDGVPASSVSVVRSFRGRQDPMTVAAIAGVLDVAPSTASRLVDSAVRSGHVTRGRDGTDTRFAALRLTDSGVALLADVLQAENEWLTEATSTWSARQRWAARDAVLHIADGLSGGREES